MSIDWKRFRSLWFGKIKQGHDVVVPYSPQPLWEHVLDWSILIPLGLLLMVVRVVVNAVCVAALRIIFGFAEIINLTYHAVISQVTGKAQRYRKWSVD